MEIMKKRAAKTGFFENVKVIAIAVGIAMIVRTFIFQAFWIPSGSMEKTLLIGDYLFLSKYEYGYSKYSLPFSLDLFAGRIFASSPKRGQVVVFRPPSDVEVSFIKRLIGLPGDKIQLKDGQLIINDVEVKRELVATTGDFAEYRETLDGSSYITTNRVEGSIAGTTGVYIVPPEHYFFMGDNRDNSHDSRFGDIGYIPEENLVGRALILFFSTDGSAKWWQLWKWPFAIRYDRLGMIIK